jgi:hypothetical protein
MMKRVALTVALTAATAHAQGDTPDLKDPDTALTLSVAGTVASHALVLAGLAANNGQLIAGGLASSLVMPSLGEWYAGKPLTAGMGIRAVSALATVAGLAQSFSCLDFEGTDRSCHDSGSAPILVVGGVIGYAAGTIYDIATAPGAARDYNRKHAVTVQPALLRTASGSTSIGVGIGGSFE